jgi:aminoglycoside phosphotransferase (APT) family kinase protein
LTILDREPSPYTSTFPSEVVTCRTAGGAMLRLFCKHAAGRNHQAHGHRGGVAYEARVYRSVLAPLGVPVPLCYGGYSDGSSDRILLILEHLDESLPVHKSPDPTAMAQAARWLGAFHAAGQRHLGPAGPDGLGSFLNVYDRAYYRGWARRTSQFAGAWHDRFPWLSDLCERAEGALAPLQDSPATVIHGEFYPWNILYHRGAVYPVDWESAAVAAGEIDLATLTEGWPPEVAQACEAEYRRTRWPDGPPADLERRLTAARLYLLLRWLGDRPEWTSHESTGDSLVRLRDVAERLEIL